MVESILKIEHLRKSFGTLEAVKGLSLTIHSGEIFGMLGPNGAGKTTTISMLTGLLERTSGCVYLKGEEISENPESSKAAIGLVPQDLALYPTISGSDNLRFFGGIYGLKGKKLSLRIEEVLELVGLSDRAQDPVETYSGGMKRRINIAAGLLHQPELLFLDEPTTGVDPQSRNAIFEGIHWLNENGMTIVYTTHYMEEAEKLCNRVAIVDEGNLIALDNPANLIRKLAKGVIQLGLEKQGLETLKGQLKRSQFIKAVSIQEGGLKIEASDTQAALLAVIQLTKESAIDINALQVYEPNLETVFLNLTGKQLRDTA